MTVPWLSVATDRALLSLTTVPSLRGWINVVAVTGVTTAAAGLVAAGSGFIDPVKDFDPPWQTRGDEDGGTRTRKRFLPWYIKSLSAFLFPSLGEEFLWRGVLIAPHPSTLPATTTTIAGILSSKLLPRALVVLVTHVLMHPVTGFTIWPRGREVFCDLRFMVLATIVLGGSTVSYLLSGGNALAAALTHGVCVVLWRDFFGGEAKLMRVAKTENNVSSTKKKEE
mmetsp:Transcript_3373/g.7251  ORF Transcript_3373/g.7251 Transcript_3373/m.7251 type:complete len:225 (+) Transcript_3373:463-1137(+)|eukprot:CAMPEP_0168203356 /NCGR_PEP_ID=MMETSP0139_2-20121125/24804_1 /TAXON_ID=44445 /ORGANISM="Pseudo-nitzschia australis, Strain 10249 10 AB" /LENGTH=224 /DNA_ID=CAMNT_0008129189 /DNA_START=314 /DNA_END=988 /DNA_ORIENTATION=-